jgi:hypothetical protein
MIDEADDVLSFERNHFLFIHIHTLIHLRDRVFLALHDHFHHRPSKLTPWQSTTVVAIPGHKGSKFDKSVQFAYLRITSGLLHDFCLWAGFGEGIISWLLEYGRSSIIGLDGYCTGPGDREPQSTWSPAYWLDWRGDFLVQGQPPWID